MLDEKLEVLRNEFEIVGISLVNYISGVSVPNEANGEYAIESLRRIKKWVIEAQQQPTPKGMPLVVGGNTKICDKCCKLPSQCTCGD